VIRTIKTYLGWDLAKATVLATLVFTGVMTVFVIIEPLRERGLSSAQALTLFLYSLPVVVSLALPIAALFAATIVYGRFSQENELMACRASGISTLAVLTPAVHLGLFVSVVTLGLGMYVAPQMLLTSRKSLTGDLQHIVYSQFEKQRYIKWADKIVHADYADPDAGVIEGFVGVDLSSPDVRFAVASTAKLEFPVRDNKTFVISPPPPAAGGRRDGGTIAMEDEQRIERGELPDLLKDDPKLYTWDRLCKTLVDPTEAPAIMDEVARIKRQAPIYEFYGDLLKAVAAHAAYEKLEEVLPAGATSEPARRMEIEAVHGAMHEGREVRLVVPASTTQPVEDLDAHPPVTVRQYAGDKLQRTIRAREALVRGKWEETRGTPVVSVTLLNTSIHEAGDAPEATRRQEKYELGPYAMPAEILARTQTLGLDELVSQAADKKSGISPSVRNMVRELYHKGVTHLLLRVRAEMHQRLAYGISCLLMVMLGAALGLLLRGGQVLAAFAITAVPASCVIIMLLMGKQMIANPAVPAWYGICIIWGGIAALAVVNAYFYGFKMRR
jgi:lipopolysaccharide export LptBFGC system permease protein LptF